MRMLYKLSKTYLSENIEDFICSDQCNKDNNEDYPYLPETFTVNDKLIQKDLIFFDDISYNKWVLEMIHSILNEIDLQDNFDNAVSYVQENLEILLDYKYCGKKLKEQIYNQEFIDVIRRVIAFTLFNDVNHEIDTAKIFNNLASEMMPIVIKTIEKSKMPFSDEMLLKLSIVSGLSGLDLKGAPAASSKYSNMGIPMRQYFSMKPDLASRDYLDKLLTILGKCTFPVFHYAEFIHNIQSAKKVVWFTDDYIETYFDLYVINRILKKYNVVIEIIPKNGIYGNDMSWQQLEKALQLSIFSDLGNAISTGRLLINKKGPKMGAINLKKLSNEVISSIVHADFCVMKGCRIFEMTQGFLCNKVFYSFIVARYLSEITSGFDSSKYPLIFLFQQPYEYSYFGIEKHNSKEMIFDKRRVKVSMNTISAHIDNLNTDDPQKLIDNFNYMKGQLDKYDGNKRPIYQEMELIAEKLVLLTKKTYDRMCTSYRELRHDEPHELDIKMWNMLSSYIEKHIAERPIKLLDVATGSGRDIMYATGLGYQTIGIDNSDGFINILCQLEQQGKISKDSYKKCDMRMLDFPDNSFDVVRQNASILHLPLIGKGYMADKAISESFRVLKKGGLIYIFVKKGFSLEFVDTNEGLGGRVFQFYTEEILSEVVKRNGFTILSITEEIEKRKDNVVNWLAVIAQKE